MKSMRTFLSSIPFPSNLSSRSLTQGAASSRSEHVVFGGTNRTAEESVGECRPDPETLRAERSEGHRVYETPTTRTNAIDGPGLHGGFLDRITGSLLGSGPTGIRAMVGKARQEESLFVSSSPAKAIGYSRGGVAAIGFAMEHSESGVTTEIDIRDPVKGGASSITEVGPLVLGRQLASIDNVLPGFGATLVHGRNVRTVLTLGGHSARARNQFGAPLPTPGPGQVLIEANGGFRNANRADAARFRNDAEESRLIGIHDDDSAVLHQHGLDLQTTRQTRLLTFARLIEMSTQPPVPGDHPRSARRK